MPSEASFLAGFLASQKHHAGVDARRCKSEVLSIPGHQRSSRGPFHSVRGLSPGVLAKAHLPKFPMAISGGGWITLGYLMGQCCCAP